MGYLGYRLKNMFKSKEEREIEAKMEFQRQKRSFEKYLRDLDSSTKEFERMAIEAEKSGNHQNALACTSFLMKLRNTRSRVQGIVQRFEMMYQMTRMGSMMAGFAEGCAKMSYKLKTDINLKQVLKNSVELEKSLGILDTMSEEMNSLFDSIDDGMRNDSASEYNVSANPEAENMLNSLMGRDNVVKYGPTETVPETGKTDNNEEELAKLMSELGGRG